MTEDDLQAIEEYFFGTFGHSHAEYDYIDGEPERSQRDKNVMALIAEVRRLRRQYEPQEGDPGIHITHLTAEQTSGEYTDYTKF